MMMWEPWQWITLYVPNFVTFVCYFIILYRIIEAKDLERSPKKNRFLFAAFISTCGVHHFLHLVMVYHELFYAMLLMDYIMMAASILAVKELDF